MPDNSSERVMVIPTSVFHELGVFQGFTPRVDQYKPRLLDAAHIEYRPRGQVEDDPSWKQIVPYVVLRWRDELFHYTRGKRASETRLQALRSIGVGGHIRADDKTLFGDAYREGMLREIREEVTIAGPYTEQCIGLINDDATPVGRVHLGIVHLFELQEPKVERRESALTRTGFARLCQLHAEQHEFESWSQYILDALNLSK